MDTRNLGMSCRLFGVEENGESRFSCTGLPKGCPFGVTSIALQFDIAWVQVAVIMQQKYAAKFDGQI